MARFREILDSLGVGEDGVTTVYPDTFLDDISSAYDEDISFPNSALEVARAELVEARAEIVQLKAHNYELMMQIPANEPAPEDAPGEDDGADNDDEPQGVDSLFGDDDKDKE